MVKKPFFIFFLLALVIPFCWSAGAAAQPQGKGRIVSAYWSDEAGNPVKTGYAGRPLLLSVETEGIADGETVKIDLYRDGAKSAAAETLQQMLGGVDLPLRRGNPEINAGIPL